MAPQASSLHPHARSAVQARNWAIVQADSVFVGLVTASGPFLPVFLIRLGASSGEIGLLTALPALTAFGLAIPFGRWLQGRRNIVPWYSRLRLVAWMSYAAMAAVAAVLPPDRAVPAILAVWAFASLPSTAGLVVFPIVMDGAAGPAGRFDLLGRRWAIAGLTTAIAVALAGQLLNALPFPANFEILLVLVSLAGIGSYSMSHRIVIPDQPPPPPMVAAARTDRFRALGRLVIGHRPFVRFELRAFAYTLGVGLAMPLLPLFYVHEVHAPDAWIGAIGAAQSAGAVVGYVVARQWSRRGNGPAVLLPSMLAVAAVPAALTVITWLPAVALMAFVAGVAAAGTQLAMFDRFFRRIPQQHGVTFSAVDTTVQNLALIVGPSVAAILAAAIGIRPSLLITALVGLIAVALFAIESRGSLQLAVPSPLTRSAHPEQATTVD